MVTWGHGAVLRCVPGLLPAGALAWGSVMAGVSVTGLAMDSQRVSQQSRKSLAESFADPFCQGVRLLGPATGFPAAVPDLRSSWRVVCETVEGFFSQAHSWFMANTESPVIRKAVHPSDESNDGSVNTRLQASHQRQPATD